MKKQVLLLLVLLLGGTLLSAEKKLIYYGWDSPDMKRLIQEWKAVKDLPFAGYCFSIDGQDKDGSFQAGMLWTKRPIEQAAFDAMADDAKKIAEIVDKTGWELFTMAWANWGTVKWHDDEGWEILLSNLRNYLRVAKACKAKGICFDPEPYTADRVFTFNPKDGVDFPTTAALARKRGKEFMKVIAEEWDDMVMLTFGLWDWTYGNSLQVIHATPEERLKICERAGNGIIPYFMDGCLEVVPEKLRIITATEAAYYYNHPIEYLKTMRMMTGRNSASEALVDPALRETFRRHVEGGFGMFLDTFIDRGTKELENQVRYALNVTEEYVWMYAEKGNYWTGAKPNGLLTDKRWDELVPDCTAAIKHGQVSTTDGVPAAENLVKNPGMEGDVSAYDSWLADWSKGKIGYTPDGGRKGGAMKFTGVLEGCYLQSFPVLAGEAYYISAYAKATGESYPAIAVRWKDEKGHWLDGEMKSVNYFPQQEGWVKAEARIVVPYGAARTMVVLLFSYAGKEEEKDVVLFDDLEVRKIELP